MKEKYTYPQAASSESQGLPPRPVFPEVDESYFQGLEARLMQIPAQQSPGNKGGVRRLWIISSAAAAIALMLWVFSGSQQQQFTFSSEDVYAYLDQSNEFYGNAWDATLTDVWAEESLGLESDDPTDAWNASGVFLEDTPDEAIMEYLEDHSALSDLMYAF
jgi:hypothetical protein